MNKRIQISIWFIAVCAVVMLALYAMPAQAHYTTEAQWQETFAPAFSSDLLTQEGATYLMNRVSVSDEQGTGLTPLCLPLQFCAGGDNDTAEHQVTVTATSSLSSAVAVSELPQYTLAGSQAANVYIPLTAYPVPRDTVVTLHVSAACEGQTLQATFVIPMFQEESVISDPADGLLQIPANQAYVSGEPVLVSFAPMPASGGWLTMDGAGFPAGTRFTADGTTFTTLYESAPIPLLSGQSSIVIEIPDEEVTSLPLRLDTKEQWDEATLVSAITPDAIDRSESILPTGEQWRYIPALRILDNDMISVEPEISLLRYEEEAAEAPNDDPTEDAGPTVSLQYVPLETPPFAFEWSEPNAVFGQRLHIIPAPPVDAGENPAQDVPQEDSAQEQNESDPAPDQEDALQPYAAPSGTYRLTIRWKLGETVLYTRSIDFFVQQ